MPEVRKRVVNPIATLKAKGVVSVRKISRRIGSGFKARILCMGLLQ
jgi:hypothetical protein